MVGDTVGDPFKDTTSVALNPIIKFSTLFGLLAVEIAVEMQGGGRHEGDGRTTPPYRRRRHAGDRAGLRLAVVLRHADSAGRSRLSSRDCYRTELRGGIGQRRCAAVTLLTRLACRPQRGSRILVGLTCSVRPLAHRMPPMHAMPLLLVVLCCLAIAYRYYSAFLAAKVAALDDSRHDAGPSLQRRPELPSHATNGCCSAITSPPSPAPAR